MDWVGYAYKKNFLVLFLWPILQLQLHVIDQNEGFFLLRRIKIFITQQFPKDIFDWFFRKTKQYLVELKTEFKTDFDPIVQYRYTSKTFKYVLSRCLIVINDKTDFVKIGWRKCLLNQKRRQIAKLWIF